MESKISSPKRRTLLLLKVFKLKDMGKLLDRLNKQLKIPEYHEDAEKCLILYHYLKETTGFVWESQWNNLTNVEFIGEYPYTRRYYPTAIGNTVLKGLT